MLCPLRGTVASSISQGTVHALLHPVKLDEVNREFDQDHSDDPDTEEGDLVHSGVPLQGAGVTALAPFFELPVTRQSILAFFPMPAQLNGNLDLIPKAIL